MLLWTKRSVESRLAVALAAMAAVVAIVFTFIGTALAEPDRQTPTASQPSGTPQQPAAAGPSCIDCHKNPDLSMPLGNGEVLSLYVDEAEMSQSVHQGKLTCTDCHSNITGFPHKKVQFNSKRDYSVAQYEACKRCHFANYTKTLDSIHYQAMSSGNRNAPLCTDCHGAHNVSVPDQPRSKISQSCGKCHADVYQAYSKSVHGAALVNGGSADVPVCTDCHGVHDIKNPDSASFRLNSPEMCAKCHSDAAMMSKYGLSPNVFKTYAQDFHGATVALTKDQSSNSWTDAAVCSDCHGVHDTKSFKSESPAQVRKDVVAACQKCHPDASTNFPDAWLGHYELSMEKTPLPYLVRSFYWVMIPFMLIGLLLHIAVDLWRVARNR
jgi:predicted CXXCH cytochrome family protein